MNIRCLVIVCALSSPVATPATGQATPAEVTLEPVPHPDLSAAHSPVREAIESATRETQSTPESSGAWGTLGMLYHTHELYDAARVAYHNALALAPDDQRWIYYLAFLEQQTGALDSAINHYRHAAEFMPDYLPLHVRLGQTLLEDGDTQGAKAQFQLVVDREVDNAAALAGLGNAAIRERQFPQAVGYLEAALAADSAATQLRYPLALAYRQTGAVEKAQAQAALGGREGPALADPLLESMARLSQSSHYYITLGFTASYEGRYQDAEALFRDAVRVNPDDPTAHAALGRVLELLKRFDAALDEFDMALGANPKHVMAAYFRGALLEHLERDAEARGSYRMALDAEPGRTQIRLLLGKSLLRDGEYAEAIGHFEMLAEQEDADATVVYYLGLSRLAADDCASALPALARAVELGPLYRRALEAYARTGASCPAANGAERARALETAQTIARSADDAAARETLGMALAANDRFEEAVEIQAKLTNAMPEHEFLRDNLNRYRSREKPARAWPRGHPVFAPKRVSTYNR